MEKLRIDKWLWAARFYKTRSIATDEVNLGRVHIGGHAVKPAREVRAGDTLTIWQARVARTVVVKAVSDQRGPATSAQQLYEETPESLELRAAQAEQRRLSPEPALAIGRGRPEKRDRRDLKKGWGARWSASVD